VRSRSVPGWRLQNRRAEREVLSHLIGNARRGTSSAIVVRGEAGAGKTALLDHVVAETAADCLVVRAAGVESEMELAFAGLHQVCGPFIGRLDRLPGPQRDALQTAFGMQTGAPPDRFLVGLAVLSLFSQIAEEQPVICILDDVQWLDRASAQVIGFVARRIAAEGLLMIFAVRDPNDDESLIGLPELRVGPLDDADARALLAAALPGRMDEAVANRIIIEAEGNPLALLELPRCVRLERFAGGFGLPQGTTVPGRIEEGIPGPGGAASEREPSAHAHRRS
jgi:predicted ATPase